MAADESRWQSLFDRFHSTVDDFVATETKILTYTSYGIYDQHIDPKISQEIEAVYEKWQRWGINDSGCRTVNLNLADFRNGMTQPIVDKDESNSGRDELSLSMRTLFNASSTLRYPYLVRWREYTEHYARTLTTLIQNFEEFFKANPDESRWAPTQKEAVEDIEKKVLAPLVDYGILNPDGRTVAQWAPGRKLEYVDILWDVLNSRGMFCRRLEPLGCAPAYMEDKAPL